MVCYKGINNRRWSIRIDRFYSTCVSIGASRLLVRHTVFKGKGHREIMANLTQNRENVKKFFYLFMLRTKARHRSTHKETEWTNDLAYET